MNLKTRLRRLRGSASIRSLVRETSLSLTDLVLPVFVSESVAGRVPVKSMPGVFQFSDSEAFTEIGEAFQMGIRAVILFGIPIEKDECGSSGHLAGGVIQRFTRVLKERFPELIVITDVCLCEYTNHGHCGLISKDQRILNDATVEVLARIAVSHANAGADIVAPSDMMDGRIGGIRAALDLHGFQDTLIMSYAAKFASAFYGPFRDAAGSIPTFGDRRTYQMDSGNAREALREVELDVAEGVDIVMVKPGLSYLDILWRVKERFGLPTAVYNVSGEYSMLKAASANGWIDERACVLEMMTAFKRAGADIIITYWAKDIARYLAS